jgi:hypothetical protein
MSEEEIRELVMMISDLRAKDQEKFEVHIKLMNGVVDSIREFSSSIKSKWADIQAELDLLKNTITSSLESLLASINPDGIRETTKSLDNIMNSMQKSMQGMNLDSVMQQIRFMTGGVSTQLLAELDAKEKGLAAPQEGTIPGAQPGQAASPPGPEGEALGHVPEEYKKKQEEKKKGTDKLLKPSDLFG